MKHINEIDVIISSLEKILSNTETRFDWENFSIQMNDKRAEALRQLFWQVSEAFHGEGNKCFSPEGIEIVKSILNELKKSLSK